MKIHEEFACVGYYGFGNGVELYRRTTAPAHGEAMYCSSCPLGLDCWARHRARVRKFVPDLMKLMDDLVATGLRGPALVQAYAEKLAKATGRDTRDVAPPDVHVMLGNLQDGALIAEGKPPMDRQQFTLRYPFES